MLVHFSQTRCTGCGMLHNRDKQVSFATTKGITEHVTSARLQILNSSIIIVSEYL